jgi:hypothetical protein
MNIFSIFRENYVPPHPPFTKRGLKGLFRKEKGAKPPLRPPSYREGD